MVSGFTSCSSPRVPHDATPSRPGQIESTRSREELSPKGDSDFRREATEEERGEELTGGATASEGSVEVTNQKKLSFPTNSGKTRKTRRSKFFCLVLFCSLFVCTFCCYYFVILLPGVLLGLSTLLASSQPSGTEGDDDDDDIVLSFLKIPPGHSRVSSLSTSYSAEVIRKRFDS